jgi:hypothetical protein
LATLISSVHDPFRLVVCGRVRRQAGQSALGGNVAADRNLCSMCITCLGTWRITRLNGKLSNCQAGHQTSQPGLGTHEKTR